VTQVVRTALPVVLTFAFAFGAGAAGAALLRDGDGGGSPPARTAAAVATGAQRDPAPTAPASTTTQPALQQTAPKPRPLEPLVASGGGASFASLRAGLGNPPMGVAVAPVGKGSIQVFGDFALSTRPGAQAWSTMKVALVAQLLRDRGGFAALTAADRQQAKAALTESDNGAAAAIFKQLEADHGSLPAASAAVTALLRDAGDAATQVSHTTGGNPHAVSTYGQTPWSAAAAVRLLRALVRGCALGTGATNYELRLMAQVHNERGWGIGAAGYTVPVAFKGGWGQAADGSWVVRQLGVVGSRRAAAIVAIVTRASSFEAGQALVTKAAQWVRAHVATGTRPVAGC
jgi:hypothetical protein